nr:hypothetical protein [Endozoicomonas sp.]
MMAASLPCTGLCPDLAGKVSPYLSGKEVKLQSLLFSIDEIKALRPQAQSSSEYWQPPQIINFLGCTKHIVFGMLNSGQLPLEKIDLPGRTRPVVACKKADVEKFQKDFVLLPTIAKGINLSTAKTMDLLAQKNIHPVSGADIDGGYSWLYRKRDISEHLLSQLKH